MNRAELRKLFDLYSRNQIVWGDFVRDVEALFVAPASLSTSKQAGAEPVAWRYRLKGFPWQYQDIPFFAGGTPGPREEHQALTLDDLLAILSAEKDAAPGAAVAAREQECWACNDTGSVTTSSNGSGLIEARCEACASREEAPATPQAEPQGIAPEHDKRNAAGAPFAAEDLKLPLPALPKPFIESTEIGYSLHRAPEVLRFGADCYRLALTQPTTVQQAEQPTESERAELERLRGLINTPHTDDFFEAINLEAAHQIERFGDKHDAGKTPTDWLFLIGYLAGKAATSFIRGDQEKGKHHIISSGAVLLNWWRHVTGVRTEFRPGHGGD